MSQDVPLLKGFFQNVKRFVIYLKKNYSVNVIISCNYMPTVSYKYVLLLNYNLDNVSEKNSAEFLV